MPVQKIWLFTVQKMLIVELEITVAFVHAEKDTQEIHMDINAPLVSSWSDLKTHNERRKVFMKLENILRMD